MDIPLSPARCRLCTVVFVVLATLSLRVGSQQPPVLAKNEGRIKLLDDHLLVNGEDITRERHLKEIYDRTALLVQEAIMLGEDSDMAKYYLEVMSYVLKHGNDAFKNERIRLNGIITSTSSGHDVGNAELIYALKRRNVLEAFIDASANYIMGNMGLGDMPFGYDENIQVLDDMNAERIMKEREEEHTRKLNKEMMKEKKKEQKEKTQKEEEDKKEDKDKKEEKEDITKSKDKKEKDEKKKKTDKKVKKVKKDKTDKKVDKQDSKRDQKDAKEEKSGKKDSKADAKKEKKDQKKESKEKETKDKNEGEGGFTKSGVPKVVRKKKTPVTRLKDEM